MIDLKNKLRKNRKIIIWVVLFSVVLLLVAKPIFAADSPNPIMIGIATVIGWIAYLLSYVIGFVGTVIISLLVWVAQFNNIINVQAVQVGWVTVRDVCNMFFILIVLVIAFATILRIESYQWKKMLPKLLIMAVLINFSRTIFGLIIDFGQVVMLTFVNGFAANGAGHFVDLFQMQKYGSLSAVNNQSQASGSALFVAAGIIMGLIAMIISVIVITVLMAILVMRVVMLWVYTILSPLVFLGFAVPGIGKYTSRVWEDFIKQVIIGPILAFFIWLALLTASSSSLALGKPSDYSSSTSVQITSGSYTANTNDSNVTSPNSLFNTSNLQDYAITIALLIGGLMVAQQMGGAAASIAGKGMNWAKKTGSLAAGGALLPFKGAKSLGGYGIDKLHQKTGVDLNVGRVWKGIQEKRAEIQRKRYGEGMVQAGLAMQHGGRFHGALAMTGTPGSAWEQLSTTKGWAQRFRGGKASKDEVKKQQEIIQGHEDKIKDIRDSDDYKDALKLSIALTPEQRNDYLIKQGDLKTQIEDVAREMDQATQDERNATEYADKYKFKKKKDEAKAKMDSLSEESMDIENILKNSNGQVYRQPIIDNAKARLAVHDKDIEDEREKIKIEKAKTLKYKPIADFNAIAAKASLEAEEMKKIVGEDEEELGAMLKDAIRQKDKIRFAAIAKKLAKDGNENDGLLNNMGYSATGEGLQQMARDIAKKDNDNYVGFSDQEAKGLAMEISYLAEKNNHWATARSIKVRDGYYDFASPKEQALVSASEVAKMDPQAIARQLNRLGYGGETPDGKFILNEVGLTILKTVGPKLADQPKRINPNVIARLTIPENMAKMIEAGVSAHLIDELKKAARNDKLYTAGMAVDELDKAGKYPASYKNT